MRPADRQLLFERLSAERPEPKAELDYTSPYELLVAVVLSAQTTDRRVNEVTPALFRRAPDAAALSRLDVDEVSAMIRSIGLYRNKAANLVALARQLVEQHGGQVPDQRAALEALPGVGRKTANVVLNVAFGQPEIAVDTHIFRVANRLDLAPGSTPLEVERKLVRVIPQPFMRNAHHWLLLHGRYICKAVRPACAQCPVQDLCPWPGKEAAIAREAKIEPGAAKIARIDARPVECEATANDNTAGTVRNDGVTVDSAPRNSRTKAAKLDDEECVSPGLATGDERKSLPPSGRATSRRRRTDSAR